MKKIIIILAAFLAAVCCTPVQEEDPQEDKRAVQQDVIFAKGADVSWLTQLESEGVSFKNANGEIIECMQLLRDDCSVNAIRLRVWANPEKGWNSADDVLIKARRAAALGLALMIDFHFSDTWADPGHQTTPSAWTGHDINQLQQDVADHVSDVLSMLKSEGIKVQWVQIGNETRGGMLYPLGSSENGDNFALLVNSGYDAVKSIYPDAQVIVHLDRGDQLSLYTYMFGYLKSHGGKYDMVGMSFYPEADSWEKTTATLIYNINRVYYAYGRPVMICELGMGWDEAAQCKGVLTKIMSEKGTSADILKGIFYWEPEAPVGYNGGYTKGCFKNGSPTEALDPFKE